MCSAVDDCAWRTWILEDLTTWPHGALTDAN